MSQSLLRSSRGLVRPTNVFLARRAGSTQSSSTPATLSQNVQPEYEHGLHEEDDSTTVEARLASQHFADRCFLWSRHCFALHDLQGRVLQSISPTCHIPHVSPSRVLQQHRRRSRWLESTTPKHPPIPEIKRRCFLQGVNLFCGRVQTLMRRKS
eukprot:31080_4